MNPFEKHIPSVFIICSPFQALCAIAAIRQLEIDKYCVYIQLQKGDIRNEQVINVIKQFDIPYKRLPSPNQHSIKPFILFSFLHKNRDYKRLFIGDLRNVYQIYAGLRFVSDNSEIITLDDGSISISVLKGEIERTYSERNKRIIDSIIKRRNINLGNNFLSIYSDITNPHLNIEKLDLSLVVGENKKLNNNYKGVFIVGTDVDSYCKALSIPEEKYIDKLEVLFNKLKLLYPSDPVYFIPHGREYKDYGEKLCVKYNCCYIRPKMMIELEMLNMKDYPKAIYGFTSTALFTLKKIFPSSKVVNIFFDFNPQAPYYNTYALTSKYYQDNGIDWETEHID